jgi:hypothetical protein
VTDTSLSALRYIGMELVRFPDAHIFCTSS